jgi:hypothetical protein
MGRPIVAILPRRDHNSTYSLGFVQEELSRWKPQALPQVRLNHSLIQSHQGINGN